ncbi:hypothetical protein B0H13DRAFT_601400 [Mycena leptocephala]|nr:hypothetical protein B0H13DRAFT_601400 [Mycena leptocephala]
MGESRPQETTQFGGSQASQSPCVWAEKGFNCPTRNCPYRTRTREQTQGRGRRTCFKMDLPSPPTEPEFIDEGLLCPLCDGLLPESPSPFLLNMIATARSIASSDPRPGNSQGLLATTYFCAPICSRHEFERNLLPMAIRRGGKPSSNLPTSSNA